MTKKDISKKILSKIKNKNIKPKPKWQFLANNYLLWIIGIACLLIGTIAASTAIFQISNGDWDLLPLLGLRTLGLLVRNLPYFWLSLVVLFITFGYYGITRTKTGYRYQRAALITGLIIIITFIGFSLQMLDLGQSVDKGMRQNSPFYQRLNQEPGQRWQNPETGRLAGTVLTISDSKLKIEDLQEQIWQIDISEARILLDNPKKNDKVRIIGEETGKNQFKAQTVLPWQKPGFNKFGMRLERRIEIN